MDDVSSAGRSGTGCPVTRRLATAVSGRAVQVRFEPIVEVSSGALRGVEALARWCDPELGDVSPGAFIPLAESSGLIHDLGAAVLEEAVRRAAEHRLAERGTWVACNVSAVELADPRYVTRVADVLARHELPPSALVLEITESRLVDGTGFEALRALEGLGVTVAVDDFGAGYGGFAYLRHLRAPLVKIDRELTVSLAVEPRARSIVQAVIDLAEEIGVGVVAEGVETLQLARLVARMGVRYVQGAAVGSARTLAEIVGDHAWSEHDLEILAAELHLARVACG